MGQVPSIRTVLFISLTCMQGARGTQVVIGNLFCNCVQWDFKRMAVVAPCFTKTPSKSKQPSNQSLTTGLGAQRKQASPKASSLLMRVEIHKLNLKNLGHSALTAGSLCRWTA